MYHNSTFSRALILFLCYLAENQVQFSHLITIALTRVVKLETL
ncbi:hypothetical protein OnM2_c821o52 [Erysiphe neolycopersici]|uniref:Uncharacterized protein n=1 Tax=Erysiphe neolycopersici TaxID=212602 RepID=A0A420HCX5_9PEZI|nr:hypothetical protein OnM2_c821o52 [Erysiphe neolycopersici]